MDRRLRMYDALRDGLWAAANATTGTEKRQYLRSLSPKISAVRNAYRANDCGQVELSYADTNTQAAYLLAFFPDYALRLGYILRNEELADSLAHLRSRRTVKVASFAAGPCPEIATLCRLAARRGFSWTNLEIAAFDVDTSWVFGRTIVRNFVGKALNPGLDIALDHIPFNLNVDQLTGHPRAICRDADLFVFQNILNEVENMSHLSMLVAAIVASMKIGSHLLLSDVGMTPNYRKAQRLHGRFRPGELRKFEGNNRTIERCAQLLTGSPLESLATHCPGLMMNSDQPYRFNYLYFVRGQ